MKKTFFILFAVLTSVYFVLHLVLASEPIQRRVLNEIKLSLEQFGITLEIESIEFAAFSPKLYLNKVKITTGPKAEMQIPEPIVIEKIKIEFSPMALIYQQLQIEEAMLYHPRLILNDADVLYEKLNKLITNKKKISYPESKYSIVFKRIGVVDAVVSATTRSPSLQVKSQSFTSVLSQSARNQQTLIVQSTDLSVKQENVELSFQEVDVDLDISAASMRLNKAVVKGKDLSVILKGATSLPLFKNDKSLNSSRLNVEIRLALEKLNQVKQLSLPAMAGDLIVAGTYETASGLYTGNGSIEYKNLKLSGNQLGSGKADYFFKEKSVELLKIDLSVAGGKIASEKVTIELVNKGSVSGDIQLVGLQFGRLLESMQVKNPRVRMSLDGGVKLSGNYKDPFSLVGDVNLKVRDLFVYNHMDKPFNKENIIVETKEAKLTGQLVLSDENLNFQTFVEVLGGKAKAEGSVRLKDKSVEIKVLGDSLSLSKLNHISEVDFGGVVSKLSALIAIKDGDLSVDGNFDVDAIEINEIIIGKAKGNIFYKDDLLSFEDLILPSIEPVTGSGYVDFKPKDNHFRFQANIRRANLDQIFDVLKKQKLGFPTPAGGEVGARLIVEGGHDKRGIELTATGQAKGFNWYGEKWLYAGYSFSYRPDSVDIIRSAFVKKSGALEVTAHFEKENSRLRFVSHGLRLEELSYLEAAPISGEVAGFVELKGDLNHPTGTGLVTLTKAAFRGNPIEDTRVRIETVGQNLEYSFNLMGERLRARVLQPLDKNSSHAEILLNFKQFDFLPVLTLWMGKDIPSLGHMIGDGDVSLTGQLNDFDSLRGSGSLNQFELGFKNSPMRIVKPIQLLFQSGLMQVPEFRLKGQESEIQTEFSYRPNQSIQGKLDGRLDFQFLQPFIPGLESSTGKVTMGLSLSGKPAHYSLLGNMKVVDGTMRIAGMFDEIQHMSAGITFSQEKLNLDYFEGKLGGGTVKASGEVAINRFSTFKPNINIRAENVLFRTEFPFTTKVNGEFNIAGAKTPYLFSGNAKLLETKLMSFTIDEKIKAKETAPVLNFDIKGEALDKILVNTDIMESELRGNFRLLGNTNRLALLGDATVIKGMIIFKETKFNLQTGSVRFEDPEKISPKFNMSGRAVVKEREVRGASARDYEITLQTFGTPQDYKIRLTSSPPLSENEIISLLLLGAVGAQDQEGGVVDFGTALIGKTPLQTKLQDEFGVDVSLQAAQGKLTTGGTTATGTQASSGDIVTVPKVKVQKEFTRKTKLSVSSTLGETLPERELKIEHFLNDNFTVNATAGDKNKSSLETQQTQSYGIDFRYKFDFE